MVSKSLKSLLVRAGRLSQLGLSTFVGALVAICVPLLAYLLGAILTCLIEAQLGSQAISHRLRLSVWLPDIHWRLLLLPSRCPHPVYWPFVWFVRYSKPSCMECFHL